MTIDSKPDDPVFLNARREAVAILILWACCFAWTVPYCYLHGYDAPSDPVDLQLTLGIPDWVFWGIAVPWVCAGVVSILLCLFFFQDDDLGHSDDEDSVETASIE